MRALVYRKTLLELVWRQTKRACEDRAKGNLEHPQMAFGSVVAVNPSAYVCSPPSADQACISPALLAHNPVDIAMNCARVARSCLLVSCDYRPAGDAAYGHSTSLADLCRRSTFCSQIRDVGQTEESKLRLI